MSQWSRRHVLQALGATGTLGALAGPKVGHGSTGSPNVLYIVMDQMRAFALSSYGQTNISTVHTDALMADGARFELSYNSQAVCVPSRATLVSGLFPRLVGMVDNDATLPDVPCLAHAFRDAGYFCGSIGKWHLDVEPVNSYFIPPGWRRRGFDHYWAMHRMNHDYYNAHVFMDSATLIRPVPQDTWQPTFMTDLALDFFDQADTTPWLLMLSYSPPHPPNETIPWWSVIPREFVEMVDPGAITLRGNVPESVHYPDPTSTKHSGLGAYRYMAMYYACVLGLDAEIGRLVAELKARGQYDNTIIVFTSDHGELGGSHLYYGKTGYYEEANRVPLSFTWPNGIAAGLTLDFPSMAADIVPTLHGLADLQFAGLPHGRDLSSNLIGTSFSEPDIAYLQGNLMMSTPPYSHEFRAIRSERWSFSEFPGGQQILFDMDNDPLQSTNLAQDPLYGPLLDDLSIELEDWRVAVGEYDPVITDGLDSDGLALP